MVQDQLVDYIGAQLKLGTARDAITAALIGAGWAPADVADSFKKIDGGAGSPAARPAQPVVTASPVTSSPAISTVNAKPAAMPAAKPISTNTSSPSSSGPQVIRMSDLVSASDGPIATATISKESKEQKPAAKASVSTSPSSTQTFPAKEAHSKKGLVMGIIAVLIIVILAGLAAYLYVQNSSLSGKIGSLGSQSQSVTSQVASLTAQVNSLTASGTAMNTQLEGLTSANQELMLELSFYAVPPGGAATSTSLSVTGSLGVNASKNYFLTASYGGRIFVANSKSANVMAALAPLVGSSTQLVGTYVPGTGMMTVTSVNGTSL